MLEPLEIGPDVALLASQHGDRTSCTGCGDAVSPKSVAISFHLYLTYQTLALLPTLVSYRLALPFLTTPVVSANRRDSAD